MTNATPSSLADVTCAGCGCACDDLSVQLSAGRVVEEDSRCELACKWFAVSSVTDQPIARLHGQPAELNAAIDAAVDILAKAQAPLIMGLSYTTCEAQREAIALARQLGATIDPLGVARGPRGTLLQVVGLVTATFGELRHRADLIVLWNVDPAITHPRFFDRYALFPRGNLIPQGRRRRTCIAITDRLELASNTLADQTIAIRSGAAAEAVDVIRGLLQGVELDADWVVAQTGVFLDDWRDLVQRFKAARYGAVILPADHHGRCEAAEIVRLVRELNNHTRFVACRLTAGNAAGAAQVLAWQTGFPCCVNFARGYPRFDPLQFDAARLLERGEVDAVVIVADDPADHLTDSARQRLASLPMVVIDSRPNSAADTAAVFIHTARPGVECGGTMFRSDGVPLRLQAVTASQRPSDAKVLSAINSRLQKGRGLAHFA